MQLDLVAVHKTTAALTDLALMLVTLAQHIHCVYVRQVAKVEHHVAGRLLAATTTALVTSADQHVVLTLLFAVSKVQHTKAGADLIHGTM